MASLDLPADALLDQMHRVPKFAGIPALALANTAEETKSRGEHAAEFRDCQMKFDRAAMLRSVAKLAAAVSADTPPVPAGEKG